MHACSARSSADGNNSYYLYQLVLSQDEYMSGKDIYNITSINNKS